jgi:hypothetical protein
MKRSLSPIPFSVINIEFTLKQLHGTNRILRGALRLSLRPIPLFARRWRAVFNWQALRP